MQSYTDLIKALRHYHKAQDCNECAAGYEDEWCDKSACIFLDAAAAIEELQAVLKEADKKQEYQHDCICELTAENEELKAEVKRLEPKRGEKIVRCGECDHRYDGDCPLQIDHGEMPDNWFCADGEREVQDA